MPPPQRSGRRLDVTGVELVGGVEKRSLVIVDPDPSWPEAAKPIVDMLVTVDDITAEEDYLPPLMSAGYQLRVREPRHRMVRTPALDVHLHILEWGDPAAVDYLVLRDHLRRNHADHELYERAKRELVRHDWPDMNAYADAKTVVIAQILERARADGGGVRVPARGQPSSLT